MIANKRNPFLFAPADAGKAGAAGAPAATSTGTASEGEEAGEGGDEDGDVDEADADPAPAEVEKKEMSATARAGFHLRSKTYLVNQIATGYETINGLSVENAALHAKVAKLEAAAAGSAGRERKLAAEVSQAAAEKATVGKEVRKELTSLGVSEAAAPAQLAPDQTPDGLLETFNGLTGSAKIAFFRKHETALLAADAAATKTK